MANYNALIDEDEQIDTEERIASILFDIYGISETTATDASKDILLAVLETFRPDLVEDDENDDQDW